MSKEELLKPKRHNWNGMCRRNGFAVSCYNCGCVKEYVKGTVTYFLNDNVHHKAPPCIKPATEAEYLKEKEKQ